MATPTKGKSRLGRGLSSLISVSDLPVERELPSDGPPPVVAPADTATSVTTPAERVVMVQLEQVRPNPHQPRRVFDQAKLAELSASIRSTGLIQPIVVRQRADGYELIAGERRWRAAKLAGLAEAPAIVRDVDSLTQAQMALIENIQREDLNPVERAEGYRTLLSQLGLSHVELATRLGEDRATITNHMRLLDLAEPVRELLRNGRLSLGHGKALAGVADLLEQVRLAELVVQQDLSVRNLERLITGPTVAVTQAGSRREASAHVKDVERSLTSQLGLRVQLRSARGGKGRLVIHYGSLDQFDSLLDRLGVKVDS